MVEAGRVLKEAPPSPAAASSFVPWRPHCRRNFPSLDDNAVIAASISNVNVSVARIDGDIRRLVQERLALVRGDAGDQARGAVKESLVPICGFDSRPRFVQLSANQLEFVHAPPNIGFRDIDVALGV